MREWGNERMCEWENGGGEYEYIHSPRNVMQLGSKMYK